MQFIVLTRGNISIFFKSSEVKDEWNGKRWSVTKWNRFCIILIANNWGNFGIICYHTFLAWFTKSIVVFKHQQIYYNLIAITFNCRLDCCCWLLKIDFSERSVCVPIREHDGKIYRKYAKNGYTFFFVVWCSGCFTNHSSKYSAV